jgi:hypothetical protein
MNPAILNYWQSQQQIGDQMQLLNNNAQSADNAQMSVGANPFDAGIQRAISTARDSLGMTEKQQDRALRRSLLNFAANIAQTPKSKGFFNNFGDISRAALPAISEYDNAEAEAEMANNALANQILNYQKGLRAEAFEREKFNSQAKFQQDQLAETKRYHDLMNDFNKAKIEAKNKSAVSPLGDNFTPIESKTERTNYSKLKQSTGEVLGDLGKIKQQFENLQEITKDDLINPMNPYVGSYANQAKDLLSYFNKDSDDQNKKAEREKSIKRKAFEAEVNKFQVEFERKLKGGVLGKGIIEIFDKKKMLPSVGDAPDVFQQKLEDLNEMISNRYEAADNSLRYNTHISPYDMESLKKQNALGQNKQQNMGQAENKLGNLLPAEPGYAHVIDTRNNEIVEMAQDDIEPAIASGQYKRLP